MTRDDLARAAERILARRRMRDRFFRGDLDGFGEPAWDMLLMLVARGGSAPAEVLVAAVPMDAEIVRNYLHWLQSHSLAAIDGETVTLARRGWEQMAGYLAAEAEWTAAA